MSKSIDEIILLAKAEIGYKEGKNNDTKFGIWYGLNHQPWCAMFISYLFYKANLTSLIAQSPKGFAGCESFEAWAQKRNLTVPVAQIQAGDILLFDFNKSGVSEHVEIATGVIDEHTHLIPTIGGNTGADHIGVNQANGDGVYAKVRTTNVIRLAVRPKYPN